MESEVKSTVRELTETVKSPSVFRGGKYQDARREFSVLAVMFAIISGYDNDVRWKRNCDVDAWPAVEAGPVSIARSAPICLSKKPRPVTKTWKNSCRGENPSGSSEDEKYTWDKVSGRPPLMQRLDRAQQQGLVVWTSDNAQFQKNRDQFTHEAELIAALAEVIGREGFEYADDSTYQEYIEGMRSAAKEAAAAAREKNYDAARKAVSTIDKELQKLPRRIP